MPSGRSLGTRVAVGTAIAAAIASLIAASVTVVVTARLVVDQEEHRLHEIGSIALREFAVDSGEKLQASIKDEIEELSPEGVDIAVRDRDGKLVGGDPTLPDLEAERCATVERRHVCATANAMLKVVAAASEPPSSAPIAMIACAIAVVIAAIAAALIGRSTTRWALGPLFALQDSLSSITDESTTATLAGDDSVAEIAALRSAMGDLLARLGRALEGARRFSADAAHELKTPLTAIRAELDLLAEESLDASAAAAVERLRGRVIVLTRLIERLLALTKATTRGQLEVETLALEDVVQEVISRLPPAGVERVRFEADAPGMVNGDELLLAALLENAIDNALKFSGEKPIDVKICEVDGRVVLKVTDDGPGLPPDERARAFEPFFRAPSSRAHAPGHGVGLAIVAQVAGAHHGSAAFVDSSGRGACLEVRLPAWSAPAA
jgi:signal transduction histidine kinase